MTLSSRHFSPLFLLLSALAPAIAGCSSPAEENAGGTDDDSAELTAGVNSNFYIVTRRDLRRCVAPLCGGFYVKRVNQTAERYVSGFNFEDLGLSAADEDSLRDAAEGGKAILRGKLSAVAWNNTTVNEFKASEGWKGATGNAPTGSSFRITSSGIVCITSPCPTLHEGKLNSSKETNIHDLDLGASTDQALVDQALAAVHDTDGILVAGVHSSFRGPAGRGSKLKASEFYFRVQPSAPITGKACGSRGMQACPSDQFCDFPTAAACGTFDAGGTCATKPQACIQIYKPVCGCDGQTYGNSCAAHSAGVSVSAEGACP
jgi:hypothetical protein